MGFSNSISLFRAVEAKHKAEDLPFEEIPNTDFILFFWQRKGENKIKEEEGFIF